MNVNNSYICHVSTLYHILINLSNHHTMKFTLSIFLILLISMSSCKFIEKKGWFGKKKREAEQLEILLARQDSIRVADSIRMEIEQIQAIEQVRIDSIRAEEDVRLAFEAMSRFHIIVGSFLTPEYADDHLRLYQSMGFYGSTIIDGPNGRFRLVSAEAHNNINSALGRLSNYQDTVEFEAWLYIME